MQIIFNIIACMLPLVGAAEIEVGGRLMGRVLPGAIQCPGCGGEYNLIVPAGASAPPLESDTEELRQYVSRTCGNHPIMIQKQ